MATSVLLNDLIQGPSPLAADKCGLSIHRRPDAGYTRMKVSQTKITTWLLIDLPHDSRQASSFFLALLPIKWDSRSHCIAKRLPVRKRVLGKLQNWTSVRCYHHGLDKKEPQNLPPTVEFGWKDTDSGKRICRRGELVGIEDHRE